jgi:hypothetical protein
VRQPLIRRQTDFQQRVLGMPQPAWHGVAELSVATAANSQLRQLRFLKRGYAQRMRRGSKVLLTAVLAVLIVLNLLLIFLLFRPERVLTAQRGDQDPGDGGWPAATSSGSNSRASAAADQTPSASPDGSTDPMSSTRPVEAVPVKRLLLATSSTKAWRATIGDCTTPGEIERSTNGGASWKRIVATGSAPIVRLRTEPSGLFTIGGTGGSCSVRYVAYARDGAVTASTTSPPNVWFPTPKDRDEINGPSGAQANPCKRHVIGLAPLKPSQALTVCDDAAMRTHNSGKTWEQIAWIPNTLAITAGSGRYWLAGTSENCAGVTVQALAEEDGSLRRGPTRCARDLAVAAGEVAIDVTGGTIWLWSQNRIAISTDDGETWK